MLAVGSRLLIFIIKNALPIQTNWLYLLYNLKTKHMYSLKCDYYTKEFPTLDELIDDVMTSGMDPNHEVTRDGRGTGEDAIDFIQF